MTYALLVIGILWMLAGMLLNTQNANSAFAFKVFPFLSGMYVAVYAANDLGWLVIP